MPAHTFSTFLEVLIELFSRLSCADLHRKDVILQGETHNPTEFPSGCRFHLRGLIFVPVFQQIDSQRRRVA
jgi:hypothetical protein